MAFPYPSPTTGIGVATQISIASNAANLQLSGTNTAQIVPLVKDAAGTIVTGVVLTLTSVATASGGTTTYTGTITNGGSNAYAGYTFTIAGFVTGVNNGTFECAGSTATTLVLDNTAGATETHAATATSDDAAPFVFKASNTSVATVSAAGVITGVGKGATHVEVSYPAFANTHGLAQSGHYAEKIYQEITVVVKP